MEVLRQILSGRQREADLDRAALELAALEFPGLDIEPFLGILDSYAIELAGRLPDPCDGPAFVSAANRYFFTDLGFAGNAGDYYNPLNSCLNAVISSRTGIPITLSLIYMEVARRLAKPVYGIGLPGHFLVQFDDGLFSTFIDPFHGGTLLDRDACFRLAREVAGFNVPSDPALLTPSSKRQILSRIINNLRAIYFSRRWHTKALALLNLLLDVDPVAAGEYKQRGMVHLQMQNTRAAKADLETYLALSPDAEDRDEIKQQIMALKHWQASLN